MIFLFTLCRIFPMKNWNKEKNQKKLINTFFIKKPDFAQAMWLPNIKKFEKSKPKPSLLNLENRACTTGKGTCICATPNATCISWASSLPDLSLSPSIKIINFFSLFFFLSAYQQRTLAALMPRTCALPHIRKNPLVQTYPKLD